MRVISLTIVIALVLFGSSITLSAERNTGRLQLRIVDSATNKTVPARIEVLGVDGDFYVAKDALMVGGDCDMSDDGAGLIDLASTLAGFTDHIENPYTNSTQFYSDGESLIELPVGKARLRIFKGPEYKVSIEQVDIKAASTTHHDTKIKRWINMPKRGWYSADDHLHLPRPVVEVNPYLSKMMQAEDIHVANLLQMGKVRNTSIAPQYAHGPDSHYQEHDYILASGQENPRSHFLGHTITLGASKVHNNSDKYLIYRLILEATSGEGALNGFAHAGFPNGTSFAPHDGMAIVAPHDLLHFVEVLQFNRSNYEAWYDLLSLGFRIAPTAGTDYPCVDQNIPGHERFYTQVERPLNYNNWLDGVRQGKTFVTTGPMIEFQVDGKGIGSEIVLDQAAIVVLSGRVDFDPDADDMNFLELVQNGQVVDRFSRVKGATSIQFSTTRKVTESSWFALRGYGSRYTEVSWIKPVHLSNFAPTANVHTAPVYVTLKNQAALGKGLQAKRVAQTWLARLEDLETVLAEDNIEFLAKKLEAPDFDGVPKKTLINNRESLLEEISVAKKYFNSFTEK